MRHRNVLLTCFALTFALLALPALRPGPRASS